MYVLYILHIFRKYTYSLIIHIYQLQDIHKYISSKYRSTQTKARYLAKHSAIYCLKLILKKRNNNNNDYIDGRIYLLFLKSVLCASRLEALKPAANGRYLILMCKWPPYYLHLLSFGKYNYDWESCVEM